MDEQAIRERGLDYIGRAEQVVAALRKEFSEGYLSAYYVDQNTDLLRVYAADLGELVSQMEYIRETAS